MSKAMWIDEFDRLYNEACDAGVSPDKAYEQATSKCDPAYGERLADMADRAGLMKKEGRL